MGMNIEKWKIELITVLSLAIRHVESCILYFYREDLENIVSLDTCVHLINQNVPSCYLKLKLSVAKAWQIKKVSTVSEVRIMKCLSTVRAFRFSQFSQVFRSSGICCCVTSQEDENFPSLH